MRIQKTFTPLFAPDIRSEDIDALTAVLKTGLLVQGEHVQALENEVSNYLGCKHSICVANGTASLHLALLALGIGKGDEVIVPAFSYVATANVVELVGATPVFVDINADTFNIDVEAIGRNITPQTKAIMPVHEFGLAADMHEIMAIAEKHGLPVIEDAACALGAIDRGKYAGTFGTFGSFSLHPRKTITSGEGGIITTNDDELARKVRILRNHGIEQLDGKMEFVAAGFNYRLTDFQAAFVKSQLGRFEESVEQKQAFARLYKENIQNPLIKLPAVPEGKNHTWQTFHIVLHESLNRDKVIGYLKEEGIGSNYGAQCIPEQIFYKQKYNLDSARLFPNALKSYRQGLALPLFANMTEEDILRISQCLNQVNPDRPN